MGKIGAERLPSQLNPSDFYQASTSPGSESALLASPQVSARSSKSTSSAATGDVLQCVDSLSKASREHSSRNAGASTTADAPQRFMQPGRKTCRSKSPRANR